MYKHMKIICIFTKILTVLAVYKKTFKMSISPSAKRLMVHSGLAAIIGLIFITWLNIRPLGILFLLTFFLWLYQTKVGLEISVPEEFINSFSAFTRRIILMREENKSLFCGIASVVLGSFAILGHLLSGSSIVLTGLMISALLSTKFNFHILQIKKTEFKWDEKLPENDMDEFLLDVNETTLEVLERASAQTSNINVEDVEEKSEEIPNDLMIPDCIPEIDENSTDEDDALGIGVPEDLERSKLHSEIEFKKRHFKKDSSISTSSSDEDQLSKGLEFPDHSNIERLQKVSELSNKQTQSMIVSSNVLPGIVSGLVSWASMSSNNMSSYSFRPQRNNTTLSDDESDFEIVNTEEYQ